MHHTNTEIKIPFHDVDSMGIVWHGNYLKYFEVARCEFLESVGYSYNDMANSGYAWPIVDMRVKYVSPAHFGQLINVRCSLKEWEYRLRIDYEITDSGDATRIAKGYTIQAAVDMETGDMCYEAPPVLKDRLEKTLGPLAGC